MITSCDYAHIHLPLVERLSFTCLKVLKVCLLVMVNIISIREKVKISMIHEIVSTDCLLICLSQQTRGIHPMLFQCWASVEDDGPTLKQHLVNVSCLLECPFKIIQEYIEVCSNIYNIAIYYTIQMEQWIIKWSTMTTPLKQRQTHTDPMSHVCWVIIYMLTWYLKEYLNYYFVV